MTSFWLITNFKSPLELSRFLVSSSLGRLRCPRTKSSDIIVLQIIWAFLRFTSLSGIRVWGVWRLPAVRSWAFPFPGFIRAPSQHPFVYRVTASWCLGRVALLLQAANVSVQPNCAAFRDLLMSCFHANLLTTTLGKSKCMTSVSRLSSGQPDFYSTALFNLPGFIHMYMSSPFESLLFLPLSEAHVSISVKYIPRCAGTPLFQNSSNTASICHSCHKGQSESVKQCDSVRTGQSRIMQSFWTSLLSKVSMQYHAIFKCCIVQIWTCCYR